jgi:cytochrome c553
VSLRLGLAWLLLAAAPALAAASAAGRQKAIACAVCHGPLGLANAPDTPSLAGQPATYLAAQLRAFRSGERRHEVMVVIAKPLSDADIADLSAWFAAVQVEVKPPR